MKDLNKRILMLVGAWVLFFSSPAFSALLGSWNLNGSGQKSFVYREGGALRVIELNGNRRDYTFGNVSWALVDVRDTDGRPGMEMIVRAGGELVIVAHATTDLRKYNVGNIPWAVMKVQDLDRLPGDEVLLSIGNGIRIVTDAKRDFKDVSFPYSGSWALFSIENLSGNGPDILLNMGNGLKIIDPRTLQFRDFTFQTYSAIFGVAELDGKPGLEVIGRTNSEVYVVSGGVANGWIKSYRVSNETSPSFAIHGQTVDTDGLPGDEVIVTLVGGIHIIRHAHNSSRTYQVGTRTYSIDSIFNMDGLSGAEILIRDGVGDIKILNDKQGTLNKHYN
jgi:hypothetical protein